MFLLNIIKGALTLGASIGAGATVKYLVEAVTPVEAIKPVTKLAMKVSTLVIGAALAEVTSNYIEKQIDGAINVVKAAKDAITKVKGETIEIESETSEDD